MITKKPDFQISQWYDIDKNIAVQLVQIENNGHGIAVNTQIANGGTVGPFLLQTNISAMKSITKFWQLTDNKNDKKS